VLVVVVMSEEARERSSASLVGSERRAWSSMRDYIGTMLASCFRDVCVNLEECGVWPHTCCASCQFFSAVVTGPSSPILFATAIS
jgi:hypothetical protein